MLLVESFDSALSQVVDLPEETPAKDDTLMLIVQDLGAVLGSSFSGLVDTFRAGPNKSVSNAFRNSSIDAQYHVSTATADITLHFSEASVLKDCWGLTESDDVIVPVGDTVVIKL